MTMMEAVKVVSAHREAAVLEPLAAVVALYESTTIAALETATSWSCAIKVAACIRSGTAVGAAGEVAATARHCAGMATTTAPSTATTAAAATAEGSMASATPIAASTAATSDEDEGAVMDGTYSVL
jgi:hypothetical protein